MKIAAPANRGEKQEELGQFLTASLVAGSMASMFGLLPKTVRLLDAGAVRSPRLSSPGVVKNVAALLSPYPDVLPTNSPRSVPK